MPVSVFAFRFIKRARISTILTVFGIFRKMTAQCGEIDPNNEVRLTFIQSGYMIWECIWTERNVYVVERFLIELVSFAENDSNIGNGRGNPYIPVSLH